MWVIEPHHDKETSVSSVNNKSENSGMMSGGEALTEFPTAKMSEGAAGGSTLTTLSSMTTLPSPPAFRDFLVPYNNNNNYSRGPSPLQYGADEGSASSNFLSLLERELVHPTTFTQTFLQSILSSIESRDPVVANAWLETLLDVIDLLPSDVIRNEILAIAISKGQLSQPLASRVACCKLLGKIASKFEPYMTQQEVLPAVLQLCQESQAEVRAAICTQLPALARGLGCELARPALLPSLVELASDEETPVRLAAVQAVADMIAMLDHESRQQIIVPLVRKLCECSLRSEDTVLMALAKQIGLLCYSLSDQMCVDDTRWFLHFYQRLSQLGAPSPSTTGPGGSGGPTPAPPLGPMPDLVPVLDRAELHAECRRLCAFNLPGMLVVGGQVEPEALRRVFCQLAGDMCHTVRRTVASSIHEIARMVGAEGHGSLVRSQLSGLLCDSSEEVLESLVPHLGTTLELLAKSGALKSTPQEESGVVELCRALLHCEEEISQTNNWRLQACMLAQVACLPHCVAPDLVFNMFVPRMFAKMHQARPLPCRVAAARSLLTYLAHLTDDKQRASILARLDTEFVRGESCYSRMLFLRMCPDAMAILSPPFFKQHLFAHVLKLAGDRVANIQLEVCTLLCPLKNMLRLPLDRRLLHELESCVGSLLLSARDRDVNAALATAIQQLDKIELQPAATAQQEKSGSGLGGRMDVVRRSLTSAHRSVSSRPASLVSRVNDPGSKVSAPSPQRSEKLEKGSKLRKPSISSQDSKIPQSTVVKPSAVAPSISQVDPSTDEFYIDAGIRITNSNPSRPSSNTSSKIPNLQEILKNRKENEQQKENLRSRLDITAKKISGGGNKKTNDNRTRDASPTVKNTTVAAVTLRNQRPQSVASNTRKSLNLDRSVTRRSLPPQDRISGNTKRSSRPQSCLIIEPVKSPRPESRSLSDESLQIIPPQRSSRLTVTKIPKVNNGSSPIPSRSTSPNVEGLKYQTKTKPNLELKLTGRNRNERMNGHHIVADHTRSSSSSRDPSPGINGRRSPRVMYTQQKRPGISYTAPSSRGTSPDRGMRYGLHPPQTLRSMPNSPSGALPPSRLPVPAAATTAAPSGRYGGSWNQHDCG